MHRRTTVARLGATALASSAVVIAGLMAPATSAPDPHVLAKNLTSPLSMDAADDGTLWFSENFAHRLMRVAPGGTPEEVLTLKRGEIGAISVEGDVVTFAVSRGDNEVGFVKQLVSGQIVKVADLAEHERSSNPDGEVTYGFTGVNQRCIDKVPSFVAGRYRGVEETHPYATVSHGGVLYVADAGANAILAIADGIVSTVAVVPPASVRITAKIVRAFGLPSCVRGKDYRFESVPTDVEVGPDGMLYVSSLPGGPEDGSTGANGAVFRIDPTTGESVVVGSGLISAAGVAVAEDGTVYASELFGNRIVSFSPGSTEPTIVAEPTMPSALELVDGALVATTSVLTGLSGKPQDKPKGRIEVIPLG